VGAHKLILVVTSIPESHRSLVFKNEDIPQINYEGMPEANSDENMQRNFEDKTYNHLESDRYLRVEERPALQEG
jgi:hypothetical protein